MKNKGNKSIALASIAEEAARILTAAAPTGCNNLVLKLDQVRKTQVGLILEVQGGVVRRNLPIPVLELTFGTKKDPRTVIIPVVLVECLMNQ